MKIEHHTHPAFGKVSLSRVKGTNEFYGSDIQHNHFIRMEVTTSTIARGMSDDHYFADKQILRLRMASAQFSELITTMNHGSGVPCTLEFYDKQKVEPLEKFETRKTVIQKEFKDSMRDLAKSYEQKRLDLLEVMKKPTINKGDRDEIQRMFDSFLQEMKDNIPFYMESFQESMDKIVMETKMEIESAIAHKVNTLGLEALKNEQIEIDNKTQ